MSLRRKICICPRSELAAHNRLVKRKFGAILLPIVALPGPKAVRLFQRKIYRDRDVSARRRRPCLDYRDGARIIRGGGWAYDDPYWVRSAYRRWLDMSLRYENVGFRCAYALP